MGVSGDASDDVDALDCSDGSYAPGMLAVDDGDVRGSSARDRWAPPHLAEVFRSADPRDDLAVASPLSNSTCRPLESAPSIVWAIWTMNRACRSSRFHPQPLNNSHTGDEYMRLTRPLCSGTQGS